MNFLRLFLKTGIFILVLFGYFMSLADATTYSYRILIPGITPSLPCSSDGSFVEKTPGTYSVTIPSNCTATIALAGAGGGGAVGVGGNGALVTGKLSAGKTPITLSIILQAGGQPGSASNYSPVSTGGGYGAIYLNSDTLLAIAGGGGGAGSFGGTNNVTGGTGGKGGIVGSAGDSDDYAKCDVGLGIAGQGGTQTSPGAGGLYESGCNAAAGNPGSGMTGGAGQIGDNGNGGGGGGGNGYYGGGGGSKGGNYYAGGGGGGGSSWYSPALTSPNVVTGGGSSGGEGDIYTPTAGASASVDITW